MTDTTFFAPRTLPEVQALVREHGTETCLLGGGLMVTLLLRQGLLACSALVSLQRVAALAGIALEPGALRLGALSTYREIERSELVRRAYPALASAAAHVASPRIRNQGTLGGCLAMADPHYDLPVSLIALDATATLVSARGTRSLGVERLAVDEYRNALGPDELIVSTLIPLPSPRSGMAFTRSLSRSADDYAAAHVAVRVRLGDDDRIADVRVVLGSLGPRVFRAASAEDSLRGRTPAESTLRDAAEAAAAACEPDTDARGTREYKRDLVRAVVPRVVREALRSATEAPA